MDIQRYVPSFDSKKCFFAMPVVLFKHILTGEVAAEQFVMYPPGPGLAEVIRYFFLYQPGASSTHQLAFADGLPGLLFLPGAAGALRFRTPRTRKVRQAGGLVEALLEGVYLEESPAAGPVLGARFTPKGCITCCSFPCNNSGEGYAGNSPTFLVRQSVLYSTACVGKHRLPKK